MRADVTKVGPDLILQPLSRLSAPGHAHGRRDLGDADAHWYRGFRYVMDGDTGPSEDLFSPGLFRLVLKPGSTVAFAAWAVAIPPSTDPMVKVAAERRRIRGLGDANEGLVPDLRRAADGSWCVPPAPHGPWSRTIPRA